MLMLHSSLLENFPRKLLLIKLFENIFGTFLYIRNSFRVGLDWHCKYYIIMSCSSNFVFCRKGNDYCRSRKMVATFMPMYFVSMIFVPVERIVAINIITSNYIWTKQTFPNHQSELFLDLWFNFKQSFDLSRWTIVTYHGHCGLNYILAHFTAKR